LQAHVVHPHFSPGRYSIEVQWLEEFVRAGSSSAERTTPYPVSPIQYMNRRITAGIQYDQLVANYNQVGWGAEELILEQALAR
jgi:hypothetical protein